MESPQLENGYTKIANEIIEALSRTNLSSYESRILWCVFRKTYGFQKREDWISISQFVEITGIKPSHISRSIKLLTLRGIVTKGGNKIRFNKLWSQWKELPMGVNTHKVTPLGSKITPRGISKLPKGGNTKETLTKETIQKKTELFENFWNMYGKKEDRFKCFSKFLKLDSRAIDKIFEVLPKYIWSTPDVKYRKNPLTWLNGRCWEDETITPKKPFQDFLNS